MDEKNDIKSHISIDFDISDVDIDENMDEIIGHDSYEHNKSILMRPYHTKNRIIFEVEDCDDNLLGVANDPKLLEIPDYGVLFKSNENFLTSTVLDELEASHDIEQSEFDDFLTSKMSTIELKLSSFVENIHKDLSDIKEMLRTSSKKLKIRQVEKDLTSNPGKNEIIMLHSCVITFFSIDKTNSSVCKNSSPLSDYISELNQKNDETREDESQCLNGKDIRVQMSNSPVPSVQDIPLHDEIPKETYLNEVWKESESETEVWKDSNNMNVTFVTKLRENYDQHLKVSNEETVKVQEASLKKVVPKASNVIVLPNSDIDRYKANEELLDDMVLEEALVS